MTNVLFVFALVLSVGNVLLFCKLSKLLILVGEALESANEALESIKDAVDARVYELLSRTSISWDAGFKDRSMYIRFGNGLVKKAEYEHD